uniref:Ribonuclease H-like domain-containing protein n=1 Tax=Tanacetum cinerariifolium TaxID=118510 RepID=A0A6L2LU66_TANCI|nr:ribonuclease H-like domain-containing protein [Tanacetum cinerariifolium]
MVSDPEWKWSYFVTTDTNGMIKVLPPKTAKEVVAKERERKARTTLIMALPEDHLAKFHKMADSKEMWEAIKSRFGGNHGLHKGYDRFQTLLIQLEIHGAGVSHEDENQKFLRVFESDVKGTTASSSSNTQNVAFVSADNTSSTNVVSIAYSVSLPSVSKSQKEGSTSYTDEVIHSFFSNQSSAPQLDYYDLEQINDDDMEEMDLKWQVAMISMRIRKFYKRTCRKLQSDTKDPVGFDKTKVECINCHKMGYFSRDCRAKGNQDCRRRDDMYNGNKARDIGRRPAYQDDSKALVTIDGEDINWSRHVEEDTQNYAMMAYTSSNSGSDNESVFMNKESDVKNTYVNDRYADGMYVVSPPMTGNYMPFGPDVEINYSKFTYGLKQTLVDESFSKPSEYTSCKSDSSVETTTFMPAPVDNVPKVICEPKIWTDAPIIEEYESDSDDDSVENVKETGTHNHCPKVEKHGRNSHTRKCLGYAFTRKACFVCGSFSHLRRDCDFHEKRMAKQAELTKSKNKVTGHRENKPVWNNVQRVNHQNKFVPSVVLTKPGKFPVNVARQNCSSQAASTSNASKVNIARTFDNLHRALKDKGILDNGCSRHMTGNKAHIADYQEFKGGFVAFGELKHYNLFFVSQMCDKKNKVLFTDTDCLVMSPTFKLPDENQVLLKIPRQHNMYSFNLKNIDPSRELDCLFAKASIDESNKWHRRLGHVKFKNLNKLVEGNIVRGLPYKIFENDHTCVACQKGKQHKASYKAKTVNSVNQALQILHMDLFGPTSLAWDRVLKIKDAFGNKQYKPEDMQELFRKLFNNVQNIHEELAEYINTLGWNRPAFYNNDDDDDVDYTIAITPVLSIEKPDNSRSMGDEHLDTIPATESDEVIKSSVEDLVPIPSESEGILDTMCDVHPVNNPTPLEAKDHYEIVINSNDDISSSDDDSIYNENIEYVVASPHDSEIVSLEVAEIVILKDEDIEDDNLHEKLLNVNLLIAKIEALKDNPTPSFEFLTKSSSTSPKFFLEETNTFDNSLPDFENFCFDLEEINSGSITTHSDISLLNYEAFYFDDDHIEEISSGIVQNSGKYKDSCQRTLSSKFSFPQLQLGIMYPNLID